MWQVNRKDAATGKNWQPSESSRICSRHCVDGCPTAANPDPTQNMGWY